MRVIGEAIGRPLRFEEIPAEAARVEMVQIMPGLIADMLLRAFSVPTGTSEGEVSGVCVWGDVFAKPNRSSQAFRCLASRDSSLRGGEVIDAVF